MITDMHATYRNILANFEINKTILMIRATKGRTYFNFRKG